jgi:acyl-CoA thioester hydrolase
MPQPHILPIRVYLEDTDAGGIVYHASYVRFMERARTEMMRSIGADHSAMIKNDGVMFVVKTLALDFLKPALLDDLIEVHSSVGEIANASLEMEQKILKAGETLLTAKIRLASVTISGQPCRIPAAILGKIKAAI